jgi:hypothetical protein
MELHSKHMSNNHHVYRQCALAVFGALLIVGATQPARAQLGLGLAPMRLELRMGAGQQYSGSLKLSSESGEKARVRAEVLDFNIDAQATPQFERDLPQEAAYSCKKWLTLNPMEIELEKRGVLMVRYTLRLPAEVPEGSYNCAAGFTTLPTAEAVTGMGMRMAVRVVAAFYVVVGSPPIHGRLKEIKLEPLPPGKESEEEGWQAVLVFENSGLMFYRPTGKLEVLDAEGKVAETADFPSLPVLRQREQRFLFPLKTHLEDGHYKLRARVDIGTGEIQEGSLDVAVEPTSEAPEVEPGPVPQHPQQ